MILKLVKYSLVGVINTLLTITIIIFLNKVSDLNYLLINLIGYILGFLSSYILNTYFTFKKKGHSYIKKFLTLTLILYLLNLLIIINLTSLGFHKTTSQLIGGVVYLTIGFYMSNKHIYK